MKVYSIFLILILVKVTKSQNCNLSLGEVLINGSCFNCSSISRYATTNNVCVSTCPLGSITEGINGGSKYCRVCSNNKVNKNGFCEDSCGKGYGKFYDFKYKFYYCSLCSDLRQFELSGSCTKNCPENKISIVSDVNEVRISFCSDCPNGTLAKKSECIKDLCPEQSKIENIKSAAENEVKSSENESDQSESIKSIDNFCNPCGIGFEKTSINNEFYCKDCSRFSMVEIMGKCENKCAIYQEDRINHCVTCKDDEVLSSSGKCALKCNFRETKENLIEVNYKKCKKCDYLFVPDKQICLNACPSKYIKDSENNCILCNDSIIDNKCQKKCLNFQAFDLNTNNCFFCDIKNLYSYSQGYNNNIAANDESSNKNIFQCIENCSNDSVLMDLKIELVKNETNKVCIDCNFTNKTISYFGQCKYKCPNGFYSNNLSVISNVNNLNLNNTMIPSCKRYSMTFKNIDSCQNNPNFCNKNGDCNYNFDTNSLQCSCFYGFVGKRCEFENSKIKLNRICDQIFQNVKIIESNFFAKNFNNLDLSLLTSILNVIESYPDICKDNNNNNDFLKAIQRMKERVLTYSISDIKAYLISIEKSINHLNNKVITKFLSKDNFLLNLIDLFLEIEIDENSMILLMNKYYDIMFYSFNNDNLESFKIYNNSNIEVFSGNNIKSNIQKLYIFNEFNEISKFFRKDFIIKEREIFPESYYIFFNKNIKSDQNQILINYFKEEKNLWNKLVQYNNRALQMNNSSITNEKLFEDITKSLSDINNKDKYFKSQLMQIILKSDSNDYPNGNFTIAIPISSNLIINDKYNDMFYNRGIDIFGNDDYVNDKCQVYTDPKNLTAYSNTYKKKNF